MKTQIVQPGAPGEPTRVISARQAADLSRIRYTAADVRFMQGMIGHHAQALEMTALVTVTNATRGHAIARQPDRDLAGRRNSDDAGLVDARAARSFRTRMRTMARERC